MRVFCRVKPPPPPEFGEEQDDVPAANAQSSLTSSYSLDCSNISLSADNSDVLAVSVPQPPLAGVEGKLEHVGPPGHKKAGTSMLVGTGA